MRQFDAYHLMGAGGTTHPYARAVILRLLSMIRVAAGPLLDDCAAIIEYEIEMFRHRETTPGWILTYTRLADELSDSCWPEDADFARVRWRDVHEG
ncbi:MAG: hypothetical protein HRU13_14385 [Phycisphaerales bacterium]|nr:hypothetical protein [Phycisphaerales bacterium]